MRGRWLPDSRWAGRRQQGGGGQNQRRQRGDRRQRAERQRTGRQGSRQNRRTGRGAGSEHAASQERGDVPDLGVLRELRSRLAGLMPQDQHRLRRRIEGAKKSPHAQAIAEAIRADVERAEQRVATRRAGVPQITYPEQLPVSQRQDDILAAIRDHQVVIVAGRRARARRPSCRRSAWSWAAGSPGRSGTPSRAGSPPARSPNAIAEELGTELGGHGRLQGPVHRPGRRPTLVKVMTDGILLAEIQHGPAAPRSTTR